MVFRRRNPVEAETPPPTSDPTPSRAEPASSPIEADKAVDFLAELLRAYGEHAFDLGSQRASEIRELFEAWARHLLIGVPAPSHAAPDEDQERDPAAKRDLPGLRQAFGRQRRSERDYVVAALGDFRDATWAFISGLRRSLTVEQAADRRIGHRMRRLESAVRSGDAGTIRTEAQETVGLLTEILSERGARHQAQITEMARRLEGLRDELDNVRAQAAIDSLTGVYNRAAFDEQIEREVDLATLFGRRACLIMVDIDHFKWVNDNHGHPVGDQVLREVADTLSRCFMRRDDFLARYGGEEFVIVLRDLETDVASGLAERGMTAIRNLEVEVAGADEPLRLTASMGLARLRQGEGAPSWIERADRALYQAKDAGRDRVVVDPVDADESGTP